MDRNIFRENLIKTVEEVLKRQSIGDFTDYKFTVLPIEDPGKTLSSNDDYMRLWVLSEKNTQNRYFDLEGVVNLLSGLGPLFPLWINVNVKGKSEQAIVIELQTSLRFRKPSLLKNQENGHPPFKALY